MEKKHTEVKDKRSVLDHLQRFILARNEESLTFKKYNIDTFDSKAERERLFWHCYRNSILIPCEKSVIKLNKIEPLTQKLTIEGQRHLFFNNCSPYMFKGRGKRSLNGYKERMLYTSSLI